MHTEVPDEILSERIGRPFSVHDVFVRQNIEAKPLETLNSMLSLCFINHRTLFTLLKLSKPPSVSSIFLIHFWASLKRCLMASLKGSSQGSILMMPVTDKLKANTWANPQCLPVPSFGIASAECEALTRFMGGAETWRETRSESEDWRCASDQWLIRHFKYASKRSGVKRLQIFSPPVQEG